MTKFSLIIVFLTLFLTFHDVITLDRYTSDGWFYRSYSGLREVPDIPKEAVRVYLDNNRITTLPRLVFSKLQLCSFMSVHSNLIAEVQPGAFQGLNSLHELWLNDNKLTALKNNMFSGLGALENLVLTDNPINSTEDDAFVGLENLEKIYFHNNAFTTLKRKMFAGLDSLNEMVLSFNKITKIEEGTFTGLGNLTKLWLDNNNVLEHVTQNTFVGLDRLEFLSIHTNKIKAITGGLFTHLDNLKEIDLDDNEIAEVREDTFRGLVHLSKIWLYNNKLTTLSSSLFTGLPRTLNLTLGGNPLSCDSRLCWLKQGAREGWIHWIQYKDRPLEPDCQSGVHWKNLTLDCRDDECPDPGDVPNSFRSSDATWPFQEGSHVTYTCVTCYKGGGAITCQSDGTWTTKPQCKAYVCNVLGAGGTVSSAWSANYTCGTRLRCPDGSMATPEPGITCPPSGVYTGPAPQCPDKTTTTSTTTEKASSSGESNPQIVHHVKSTVSTVDVVLIVLASIVTTIVITIVVVVCLRRKGIHICYKETGNSDDPQNNILRQGDTLQNPSGGAAGLGFVNKAGPQASDPENDYTYLQPGQYTAPGGPTPAPLPANPGHFDPNVTNSATNLTYSVPPAARPVPFPRSLPGPGPDIARQRESFIEVDQAAMKASYVNDNGTRDSSGYEHVYE